MSNFRRMLMMLAQDLPKRESICAVDEYSASDLGVSWVKDTMYKPTSVTPTTYLYNVTYLYNCDSILPDDYIRIFAKIQDSSLNVMCIFIDGDNVVGSSAITNTYPSVDGFYVSDNLLVPNDTKQIGFNSHGNSASKSGWRLTRTRTISQDAYDYALSFGKKVVKDLKKVIDASDNPALLIKRINDWKYLIHSLVDTGYTSWLKGDGSAYVNTNIKTNMRTKSEVNFMFTKEPIGGYFYGAHYGNVRHNLGINNNGNFALGLGGKYLAVTSPKADANELFHAIVVNDANNAYLTLNDIVLINNRTSLNTNLDIYIFKNNGASENAYADICFKDVSISDNEIDSYFVPYYNGTEYCMLDINSGVIYENANVVDGEKVGAFSLSVTDAKGNEYEDFCDVEGNRIVTTLNDGEILCWKQIAVSHKAIENCRANGGAIETIDDYISYTPTNGSSNNGTLFTIDTLNVDVKVFIQFLISQNTSHKMAIRLGGTGGNTPDSQSLIQFTPTDEFKSYNAFANNLKQRSVCSIRNDAPTLGHNVKYVNVLDVSTMFTNCSIEIPQTKEDFVGCFPNLGYTTYSASPIPLIVLHGTLHYALNKSVRDYAEEKGKLDALNAYCCENKDAIAIFNADKTKVDTLLS